MSCKSHLYCGDVSVVYHECIYPDTLNLCASENSDEGGMTAEIDGEECLIEIKVGSEVYLALEKYFRR